MWVENKYLIFFVPAEFLSVSFINFGLIEKNVTKICLKARRWKKNSSYKKHPTRLHV
jgi:hypothetical protein